jgi:hypothetical protein
MSMTLVGDRIRQPNYYPNLEVKPIRVESAAISTHASSKNGRNGNINGRKMSIEPFQTILEKGNGFTISRPSLRP